MPDEFAFPRLSPLRSHWTDMAACIDLDADDGDLFFSNRKKDQEKAVAICHTCPVEDVCLEYSLDNEIEEGTWGGRLEEERQAMIRERRDG